MRQAALAALGHDDLVLLAAVAGEFDDVDQRRCIIGFGLVGGLDAVRNGNRQLFDTTYTFDRAIISMPDGSIISGTVSSWKDYEDGDQIQVVIDGTTYLVHSSNIVLMNE